TAVDGADFRATEWFSARMDDFLPSLPDITFVLFCQSESQRRLADRIFLQDTSRKNLRIVDVSHQVSAVERLTSAMYVLSSVDAVLSLKPRSDDAGPLLEVQVEAMYAACAGVPCILVCDWSLRNLHPLLPIPHLTAFTVESARQPGSVADDLRSVMLEFQAAVDQKSQEQWLETIGYAAFGAALAALSYGRV
ncbi:MAG: hypothetical protein KDD69_09440, partial [Bdellovibrionales bacterium]|nr:hypothetical protein [Bdellovibrionales bacterium]